MERDVKNRKELKAGRIGERRRIDDRKKQEIEEDGLGERIEREIQITMDRHLINNLNDFILAIIVFIYLVIALS